MSFSERIGCRFIRRISAFVAALMLTTALLAATNADDIDSLRAARQAIASEAVKMSPAKAGFGQQATGLDLSRLLELSGQREDYEAFTDDHRYFQRDVKSLVERRRTWALCAVLDHENVDAKIYAARGLLELADPASVPVLLAASKRNNYFVCGSEGATLHSIYRGTLKSAMEKITGLKLTPGGLRVTTYPEPGRPKVIRSEDCPAYFAEEIDFAKVAKWLQSKFRLTTLRGKVIEKPWTKSIESWNAGGSEYYVLAVDDVLPADLRSAKEGVVLRPSTVVPFDVLSKFKGKRVVVKGRFVEGKPYVPPADSFMQMPVVPDVIILEGPDGAPVIEKPDPPLRDSGFKVLKISQAEASEPSQAEVIAAVKGQFLLKEGPSGAKKTSGRDYQIPFFSEKFAETKSGKLLCHVRRR